MIRSGAALVLLLAFAAPAVGGQIEAHDYLLSCAGCHGLDGRGSARVPTLRGIGRLLERTDGRGYLVRVPGVAQSPLSDERLAAMLNWLLRGMGEARDLRPYGADEVRRLRAAPLRDPETASAVVGRARNATD